CRTSADDSLGTKSFNGRTSGSTDSALVFLWLLRGAPDEHHPGLLRVSDRLHAESVGSALRHRPERSGEVGHADEGTLVLGRRVPELELPSGTSLLSRRSVLPSSRLAACADSLLPATAHAMAELRPLDLWLARRESRTAHGLEPRNVGVRSGVGGDPIILTLAQMMHSRAD